MADWPTLELIWIGHLLVWMEFGQIPIWFAFGLTHPNQCKPTMKVWIYLPPDVPVLPGQS
jgi:hypothetical protein